MNSPHCSGFSPIKIVQRYAVYNRLKCEKTVTTFCTLIPLPWKKVVTELRCWCSVMTVSACFYRAMHFSANCKARYCDRMSSVCVSVRLSDRPSVRLSVTLVDCDHIGWNSSKIISSLVSLGCSLFATPT